MIQKRLRSKICLALLCAFTCGILYSMVLHTNKKSNVLMKGFDIEELMTQDPVHVAKQKEYEREMMQRLRISYSSSKPYLHRMDRDPQGVLLQNDKSLGFVGLTNNLLSAVSNALKNKSYPKRIIVHLDLKGAPPKISYLKKMFVIFRSLGATGILVEYEDMFPYTGKLVSLSALNAYTRDQITELYDAAKENSLEFIPLIQTFGHLEFALKSKDFSHLREVPNYPQVICPTHNGTQSLLQLMVDQIMELHPGINWLHIGSDEVFHIGECQRCQKYLSKKDFSKDDLFLEHARQIGEYVKKSYDITPIMWDDEFRKISAQSIKKSGIGQYIEIMVWWYAPGILNVLPNDIWEKYNECFQGIWMASSFKGADKPDSFITDIRDRLNNHKEWLEIFNMYKHAIDFKGIALTGWQRFSHFSTLCEILPQAIPSLAVNIGYLKDPKSDHGTLLEIGSQLGCTSLLNMDLKFIEFVNNCRYPGSDILKIVQRLHMLNRDVDEMMAANTVRGWITPYHINHNFASPHYLERGLQDLPMHLYESKKLYADVRKSFAQVFDQHTIDEWLELNLDGLTSKLNALNQAKQKLLLQTTWPRRPLQAINKNEL